MSSALPEWLSTAQANPLHPHSTKYLSGFLPTMIVSIGPSARVVLEQIAARLKLMAGTLQFPGMALLAVDVIPKAGHTPPSPQRGKLLPEQYVLLTPDLANIESNILDPMFRHVRWWWQGNTPNYYGRAIARLGVVSDLLKGFSGSILMKQLRRGLTQPSTKVWVIASAADIVGASMMYDVAMLARNAGGGNISRLSLVLLLQDASTGKEVDHTDREARTFASLIELERLGRNDTVHLHYSAVDAELRFQYHQALFDDIFLVNANPHLTSTVGQPNPVLATTADTLFTLLSPGVNRSLFDWLLPRQPMGEEVLVTALGAYSFRLPRQALLQVLKARLVHKMIASLREKLSGDSTLTPSRKHVLAWLNGQGISAPVDTLLAGIAKAVGDPLFQAGSPNTFDTLRNLATSLPPKLAAILNGEDLEFQDFAGRLGMARRFVEELDAVMEIALRKFNGQPLVTIQKCRQLVRNILDDLKAWQNVWGLSGILAISNELYKEAQGRFSNECGRKSAHISVIDENAEEDHFTNYFSVSNALHEPILQKMPAYTGWHWIYDEKYSHDKVAFSMALPAGQVWLDCRNPEEILRSLEKLVDSFLGIITTSVTLAKELNKIKNQSNTRYQQSINDLKLKSMISVEFDPFKADAILGPSIRKIREATFLISGDSAAKDLLYESLDKAPQKCDALDDETATLLQVTTQIPLRSLKLYEATEASYVPTDSILHVFESECLMNRARQQRALARQKKPLLFEPASRVIFQDGELVELFARALALRKIHKKKGRILYELEPGRDVTLADPADWVKAMQTFTLVWPDQDASPFGPGQRKRNIDALEREIYAHRTEWGRLCAEVRKGILEAMKASERTKEQELAWVLEAVLAELSEAKLNP